MGQLVLAEAVGEHSIEGTAVEVTTYAYWSDASS